MYLRLIGQRTAKSGLTSNPWKLTSQKKLTVDQVHQSLVEQGALDICCIKVPPERQLYEYFIVCSARTSRHLKSIPESLSQLSEDELGVRCVTEGTKATDGWSCADLQNIIVHVMEDEIRETYDLESLWALGEQYDAKMHLAQDDVEIIMDLLAKEKSKQENNFDDIFANR